MSDTASARENLTTVLDLIEQRDNIDDIALFDLIRAKIDRALYLLKPIDEEQRNLDNWSGD